LRARHRTIGETIPRRPYGRNFSGCSSLAGRYVSITESAIFGTTVLEPARLSAKKKTSPGLVLAKS
jgi:hypothetical protein